MIFRKSAPAKDVTLNLRHDDLKYLSYTAKLPADEAVRHALAFCARSLEHAGVNEKTYTSEGLIGGKTLHEMQHARFGTGAPETQAAPVRLALRPETENDIRVIRKLQGLPNDNAAVVYGMHYAAACAYSMRALPHGRMVFANRLLRQTRKMPTVFDRSPSNAFRSGKNTAPLSVPLPLTAPARENLRYLSETAGQPETETVGHALSLCAQSLDRRYTRITARGGESVAIHPKITPQPPEHAETAHLQIPLTYARDRDIAVIDSLTSRKDDARAAILFALDYAAACIRELRARDKGRFVLSNGFPKEKPQKLRTAFDQGLANTIRRAVRETRRKLSP